MLVTVKNQSKECPSTARAQREPPSIEERAPEKKSRTAEKVTPLKVTLARLSLKRQVEALLTKGELANYLANTGQQRQSRRTRSAPKAAVDNKPIRFINMIYGCSEEDEQPKNSYKIQLKQAHKLRRVGEINVIKCKLSSAQISFYEEDLKRVQHPHKDPLVINLLGANCLVRRVLIDPGSSSNIITKWTFDQLKLALDQVRPTGNPLVRFDGRRVEPIGVITLSITTAKRTLKENFVIVDFHPTYNLLTG
ncbi:uncharacterized protein LOC132270409 [Cornus florida]|uniref:uncharacterized protein LOC132270409 n=1 Tax=Cornus florida TaxID=4283 RepID=UPI0028A26ADC|nr:uncharacterized protein LOC132270409 [Cornus florida]